MSHWTYAQAPPGSDLDLEQGDILRPSEDLRKLFEDVHPHFCDAKYNGFLIATQSCDLVRRKKTPKALYISLAVIRPMVQVLPKLIAQTIRPICPGSRLFPEEDRAKIKDLLERILNQNEHALGLFFLHADSDSGIDEHSVSLLRVTVSVRSEHYDKLTSARSGRIDVPFQAKLGWLLGNLYARPASPDWHDQEDGPNKLGQLINQCLLDIPAEYGPSWVDSDLLRGAREQRIDFRGKELADLEKFRSRPPHEVAAQQVRVAMSKVDPEFPEEKLKKLENRLMNDGKFRKLFRS
jgi:hypothetical protein